MALLRLAQVPAPSVEPGISVARAVAEMARLRVGAVAVIEQSILRGIFTERDLMLRVVDQGRDPLTTLVRDVMTAHPKTISNTSTAAEASEVMLDGHLRHLPVLDDQGKVIGLLSMRALLEERLHDLRQEMHSLEQYMANDGPGG